MFNSKAFCVITVLTVLALGGAVGLQVLEMQDYQLTDKLYNKYLADMFGGGDSAAKADTPEQKKDIKTEKKKDAKK